MSVLIIPDSVKFLQTNWCIQLHSVYISKVFLTIVASRDLIISEESSDGEEQGNCFREVLIHYAAMHRLFPIPCYAKRREQETDTKRNTV